MGAHIGEGGKFTGALPDNVNPFACPAGFPADALGHRELKQWGLTLDEVHNRVQRHPEVSVGGFLSPGGTKNSMAGDPIVAEKTLPKIPKTPTTKRGRESSFPCSDPSIRFIPGFKYGMTIRNLSTSASMIKMFLTRGRERQLAQSGLAIPPDVS